MQPNMVITIQMNMWIKIMFQDSSLFLIRMKNLNGKLWKIIKSICKFFKTKKKNQKF